MLRFSIFLVAFLLVSNVSFSLNPPTKQIKHVIYITLDGVRWQDVFQSHIYFPLFWKKHAKFAEIYGEPNTNKAMEVASIPVSLPSYQSQMSGSVQVGPCSKNECGRTKIETFPEALINKHGYQKKDVATFASWELTDHALESVPGTTYSNNGVRAAYDPITMKEDDFMKVINEKQKHDYVLPDCRLDEHTFELATHYYKKYRPAFMWLSFGNADDFAHANDRKAYEAALHFYDKAIDEMISLVEHLKIGNETMIVITTDHGRGNGSNWTSHGEKLPESKQTWAFVINGKLRPVKIIGRNEYYSTLSIRPTIEAAFTK